jgi:osmotically-inducible protein OsmY
MSTASTQLSALYSDEDVQRDVLTELKWDARVSPNEIGVTVKGGVVTLRGVVDTYPKKWAAEDAALRVRGVKGVADEIEVRLGSASTRTDEDIAAAAVRALASDAVVPNGQVKVTVSNAWVTLTGDLEWQYQKLDAERVVRRLTGVRGVTNSIIVKPRVTPSELKIKIEDALVRSARTDSKKISVEVHGTKVILQGRVRSLAESREAERVAWLAPGVTAVNNQLVVSHE